MGASQHVPLRQVRGIYRVLGDARDLRDDPAAQAQALLLGLCGAIGARQGAMVRFTDFTPTGNTALTDETLREASLLSIDVAFRPELLRDALGRVEERYWNEGYNDVAVTAEVKRGEAGGKVDLVFSIEENEKGVVSHISIEGTGQTKESLVRSQLGLKPGDTIQTLDDQPIRKDVELRALLDRKQWGDAIKATVKRGDETLTLTGHLRRR